MQMLFVQLRYKLFLSKGKTVPKVMLWLSCCALSSFESKLANYIPAFFSAIDLLYLGIIFATLLLPSLLR